MFTTTMSSSFSLLLYIALMGCLMADAFAPIPSSSTASSSSQLEAQQQLGVDRRSWFQEATTVAAAAFVLAPPAALAEDAAVATPPPVVAAAPVIDTKVFVDPVGYFEITIPKYFFALRRSAKGDLPNAKTGQGRRGSSIFTAGDMAKAEVVAVERFPTRVLLEENGIDATGDLSSFPKIGGSPAAIANLINLRREKDKPGSSKSNTQIIDPKYSDNGNVLEFSIKTEIDVQKPELLMETYGVDRLFRLTRARIILTSDKDEDGTVESVVMGCFASALETDFNGPDGPMLQNVVDSFKLL